jgi:hypothetical protein
MQIISEKVSRFLHIGFSRAKGVHVSPNSKAPASKSVPIGKTIPELNILSVSRTTTTAMIPPTNNTTSVAILLIVFCPYRLTLCPRQIGDQQGEEER